MTATSIDKAPSQPAYNFRLTGTNPFLYVLANEQVEEERCTFEFNYSITYVHVQEVASNVSGQQEN